MAQQQAPNKNAGNAQQAKQSKNPSDPQTKMWVDKNPSSQPKKQNEKPDDDPSKAEGEDFDSDE